MSTQDAMMAMQMWADGLCGGAGAYRDNEKKFLECKAKQMAELNAKRISANQDCGGVVKKKKDGVNFDTCVSKKIKGPATISAEDIWADQRCGGNAA
ncbi:hypothetical protein D3C87_1413840 [compost metagenome]